MGKNNMSTNELGTLQLIIEQIANKFENRTGTVTQAEADRMMQDVNKAGGLNEQLQQILGLGKRLRVLLPMMHLNLNLVKRMYDRRTYIFW